ncbi:50S ribosomal protein L44e [Nanobdella aerobiophila]|uniref:50S ribosomal protein L44e n=1 Tax=Nanobdella aerobiophila TaxID=2586965 RepID=A0A915T021_9ARCH|nr:50S ribosomal protein L44e [Nanobdella aerobiophila]BBL45619.1 50S ribosomal protein L44e [Nanobdella aerobiophila]
MKIPKKVNKYCSYCRKNTEHKVIIIKSSKARTGLVWGSRRAREGKKGIGNKGKYSKRPLSQRKRGVIKTSKGVDLRIECSICKKQEVWNLKGRYKKVEFTTAIR